jgi:hypothetical protein
MQLTVGWARVSKTACTGTSCLYHVASDHVSNSLLCARMQGSTRQGVMQPHQERVHASVARPLGDSTLQSAVKTINPFLPEFTSSNISKISPLSKVPPPVLLAVVVSL